MLQLKNRLFQPLILHLAGGGTVHLLSRQPATIREDQLSPDIERAQTKGHVMVIELPPVIRTPGKQPKKNTSSKSRKGGRRK